MNGRQDSPSLLERLVGRQKSLPLSLHMPGHKDNPLLAPYLWALPVGLDITELPGFDDLHQPEGVLAEAMERAARLWGSRRSFLQVNGSTGALLAAIRSVLRRGDKALVARSCHKAVYHGLELCGADPVFLLPPVSQELGVAGSISPRQVEEALEEHPDCKLVIYPSPTYDGVVSDTSGICAAAHRRGIPVLVDEAHGAHLGLHPCFPPSALQGGADLVASSLHKTLPSLTQTALLHVGGELVDPEQVARQTGIFQSSSPSYLLLASIDGCLRLLEDRGPRLMDKWMGRLEELDQRLLPLRHLRTPGHGREKGRDYDQVFALDPSKILLTTQGTGLTGVELRDRLARVFGIELEMALAGYAVAMTGLGNDDAMPRRLADALRAIEGTVSGEGGQEGVSLLTSLPPRALSLEEGLTRPFALCPLEASGGRVSAEYLWAYPPGIPLIAPGEIFTPEVGEVVTRLHRAGVKLVSTRGKAPAMVAVAE